MINNYLGTNSVDMWIGLYQDLNDPIYSEPSGGWKWIDGSVLNYSNWHSSEPSNNLNAEHFGHMWGNGTWNDHVDNNPLSFAMAIDKDSATHALVSCYGGNDGQTYVTVAGGTLPYSYSWSNGQTTVNTIMPTDTAYNLSAGEYVINVTDGNGCNASDTATVSEPDLILGVDSIVACDSAIWNGKVYDTSGMYVDTLQAVQGCDSVVTLALTINYTSFTNDSLVSCDSATWNGNRYYTSGIYVDTLQTVAGCDSIVTMDMTINNAISTNDSLVSCDSATWNGNMYYTSGIYVGTLQTVADL